MSTSEEIPMWAPSTDPGSISEVTVWIKTGDTEVKHTYPRVPETGRLLMTLDRDWSAMGARAAVLPQSRQIEEFVWYEIVVWIENTRIRFEDSLETTDVKTAHLFLMTVLETWRKLNGS